VENAMNLQGGGILKMQPAQVNSNLDMAMCIMEALSNT
jgi:hypothetical protein